MVFRMAATVLRIQRIHLLAKNAHFFSCCLQLSSLGCLKFLFPLAFMGPAHSFWCHIKISSLVTVPFLRGLCVLGLEKLEQALCLGERHQGWRGRVRLQLCRPANPVSALGRSAILSWADIFTSILVLYYSRRERERENEGKRPRL